MTQSQQKGKIARLDVLRGVAILAVFLYHYYLYAFGQDQLAWKGMLRDTSSAPSNLFLVLYPLAFGWMGVSLFFVISGFVIHWSFLKAQSFTYADFYWRRFWRIYPPYLVVLIGIVIGTALLFAKHNSLQQVATHVFMVHNFEKKTYYGINGAFWSLAVEFQFYLLYPVVLILRKRIGIVGVLVAAFVLSCLIRFAGILALDWQQLPFVLWFNTWTLWPDWILGAVLAERYHKGQRPIFTLPTVGVLGVVLVVAHFIRPLNLVSFSLASLFSAALIDVIIRSKRSIGRAEFLLVMVGLWSYSFYLIHQPLIEYLNRGFCKITSVSSAIDCRFVNFPLVVVVVISLSWLVYVLVEKPSIRVSKSRLLRHRH